MDVIFHVLIPMTVGFALVVWNKEFTNLVLASRKKSLEKYFYKKIVFKSWEIKTSRILAIVIGLVFFIAGLLELVDKFSPRF